jgi:hypothetical protein
MKRTPVGTDTDAAAEAANRKQAEYYRDLLLEQREEIDRAIVEYLDVMSHGGHIGVESARELRQVMRKAEWERQAIDRMVAAIDARFPAMNWSAAPLASESRPLIPMSSRRHAGGRLYDQRVG